MHDLDISNICPNLECGSPVLNLTKNIARAVIYFLNCYLNRGASLIIIMKFSLDKPVQ